MSETALREYLGEVEKDFKRGIATEHTYRGTLSEEVYSMMFCLDASYFFYRITLLIYETTHNSCFSRKVALRGGLQDPEDLELTPVSAPAPARYY